MENHQWAIGVDLGGTKIEVARVDARGQVLKRLRRSTDVANGPDAIVTEIESAVHELQDQSDDNLLGVGVGVAGQIETSTGEVRFAPNLDWHNVPLQTELSKALNLPVIVTNDVRAATWGEWQHGAGQGADDLICLFVGTGIGGGVVSGGKMLSGNDNTAGELGHMTVDLHGPICHCGNWGCLEALAGGWAIARRARQAVEEEPDAGKKMLKMAGGQFDAITTKIVAKAAHEGDGLAQKIVAETTQALIAGSVSLINAFNPRYLIFGGGIIEGLPELVKEVDTGVRKRALSTATENLEVLPAQLHNDAGVVGAAVLAMRLEEKKG